jgi:hypothetical protein
VATPRNKHTVEPYINTVGNPGVATGWGGYRPRCRSVAPKPPAQATLNLTRPTTHTPHPGNTATRHPTHPKNPQKKREPTYNNRGWGPPTGVRRLEPSALAIPPAPHTAERGGHLPRPYERDTVPPR